MVEQEKREEIWNLYMHGIYMNNGWRRNSLVWSDAFGILFSGRKV
jgi:hypothetical protein